MIHPFHMKNRSQLLPFALENEATGLGSESDSATLSLAEATIGHDNLLEVNPFSTHISVTGALPPPSIIPIEYGSPRIERSDMQPPEAGPDTWERAGHSRAVFPTVYPPLERDRFYGNLDVIDALDGITILREVDAGIRLYGGLMGDNGISEPCGEIWRVSMIPGTLPPPYSSIARRSSSR